MFEFTEKLWVVFALASSALLATSDALTKKIVTNGNIYIVGCLRMFWGLLPICVYILATSTLLPTTVEFYYLLIIALPLEVLAYSLIIKALKVSPMSVTMPFLAFTPIFLVIWGAIFSYESISLLPIIGIVITVFGCYVIFISDIKHGLLKPFKALLNEKGALYMFVVAFIYSFTSIIAKDVVAVSNPAIAGFAYMFMLFATTLPFAIYYIKKEKTSVISEAKKMFLPGVIDGISLICGLIAMQMTLVSYFITVKRLSIFFSIILGYLFFNETDISKRFLGTSMMFIGFAIIVLFG